MLRDLNPPLRPRNGHQLKVLGIARISTKNQDEASLEDQESLYREWLDRNTDRAYELICLASQGSGEELEREDWLRAQDCVESREFDLVIAEGLSRICRRMHAYLFCELCEDCDTRLIALEDRVDTAQDDWRMNSFFAAFRHEMENRDTSERIKRSHRNRFKQGGTLALPVFGYVKPAGAKTDDALAKDDSAAPIYEEWFDKLEQGATFSEIADWLNGLGVPPGRYCRSGRWDCKMVARVTRNPILKGERYRNERRSRRINKSGRRRSVKANPEERLARDCPHLAFIEQARYDRVLQVLMERNSRFSRNRDGFDPRNGVPKKRTRFPGQSASCGVCGRGFVYGGHGQTDHLMCSGAREYKCWNAITFSGPDACQRLTSIVLSQIAALPAFEPEFLEILREEIAKLDSSDTQRRQEISKLTQQTDRKIANITSAIALSGGSQSLIDELRRLELDKAKLLQDLQQIERRPIRQVEIPSVELIMENARRAFCGLAVRSPEFTRLMRQLLPSIYVFPYRLCDGGHIVLRAEVSFSAVSLVAEEARRLSLLTERLSRKSVVDLFEPPQRVVYREEVIRLTQSGPNLTERDIATSLGITPPAVQRAKALHREMVSRGLDDPYLPLIEPPEDYTKLRRHKHHRYTFEPLDGFPLAWPA